MRFLLLLILVLFPTSSAMASSGSIGVTVAAGSGLTLTAIPENSAGRIAIADTSGVGAGWSLQARVDAVSAGHDSSAFTLSARGERIELASGSGYPVPGGDEASPGRDSHIGLVEVPARTGELGPPHVVTFTLVAGSL